MRRDAKETLDIITAGVVIVMLICMLVGCRSQKHTVAEVTESSETVTDSAGVTAWQGDMTQEAWRRWLCGEMRLSVSADSLVTPQGVIYGAQIEMTAQDVEASTTETLQSHGEGGVESNVQKVTQSQHNENSESDSDTKVIYTPPDTTLITVIGIVVAAALSGVILMWRIKRKR